MNSISVYLNFLKEKGHPLSEINSGSDEIALATNDAIQALDLLRNNQVAILGGDIFSERENGSLIYAYQLWGSEYHCLNWYCDKEDNESSEEYAKRSYAIAKESIKVANDIATRLNKKCYIVIVI